MIKWIQDRLKRDEGFTLIELMVVVLIIAILIAIAIPTFLGARARAQDRAAQSSARNIVTAAKAIFTDNEDYDEATEAALDSAEPAIESVAAGTDSTDPNMVSVDGGPVADPDDREFYAAVLSASGSCWMVRDAVSPGLTNPGTRWVKDTDPATADPADGGVCTATRARGVADGTYTSRTPGQAAEV